MQDQIQFRSESTFCGVPPAIVFVFGPPPVLTLGSIGTVGLLVLVGVGVLVPVGVKRVLLEVRGVSVLIGMGRV